MLTESSLLLLAVALPLLDLGAWLGKSPGTLEEMKQTVRKKFPTVPQITTKDLAAWMGDARRDPPVLLDTRTEAEFAVSHLPGAIRVEPAAKAEAVLPQVPAGRRIVTYCSVGYRSSAMAERLQKAGRTEVANLEGSIFQWANEGRLLEANGRAVEKVHPYNEKFGQMLDEKRRSDR